MAKVGERTDAVVDVDLVKELAFLLFSIADERKWTREAVSFDAVATAWPDILAATRPSVAAYEQTGLDVTAHGES